MKLSVIIVNYNVKYYVEQCLCSLQKALKDIDSEVFVVDNHSRDGSVDYLKTRYGNRITLIESNHNLGFARANNIAIKQSQGEYVLLLNPDTFVAEDTIAASLRFMDEHPKAGGVGVKMMNPDGTVAMESRRALPTPMVSMLKMLGKPQRYYMSHLSWDEPAQIEVISGAYCLLRRKALDQTGLLDEQFFMYGEDIDLSYRLLKAEWENWYLPYSILHYKGESTQKTSFRYVHVFYQAMLIFIRKHYGHLNLIMTLPLIVAIYLRAGLALVQMLCQRTSKSLGFPRYRNNEYSYIFDGSEHMQQECHQLALRKGLTIGKSDNNCLVLDTETYSYEEMINMMTKQQNSQLGTYNRETHIIITPKEIIL